MRKDQYLGRSIWSKDSDKVSLQDDVWVSEQASLAEASGKRRDSRSCLKNALVTDYVILRDLSQDDCHCNVNISCLYQLPVSLCLSHSRVSTWQDV